MSNQQPVIVHVHQKSGCGKFLLILIGFVVLCVVLVRSGIVPKREQGPPSLITKENYDRIRVNMNWQHVESILGKEWKEVSTVGSMQTYVFTDGWKSITIILDNNLVFGKSSIGLD